MCGIAGILRVHPPGAPPRPPEVAIPEAWLDILDESIKHRGPDGQGRFRDRAVRPDGTVVDVALVHRRLAIIDLADGHQPMVSERGRSEGEGLVAVVFNGCIYNHRELRKELQAAGHRFETDHSDTEVLVHGWREWGAGLFAAAEGMLAAAIWEREGGRLALARDAFGEKPLYLRHVHRDGAWTNVFASVAIETTRLARLVGASDFPVPQEVGVREWLQFGFGPAAPTTLGRAICPGLAIVYEARDAQERSDPLLMPAGAPAPKTLTTSWLRQGLSATAPQRVQHLTTEAADGLLKSAVASRIEADTDIACFLSGGVDSSLVALHARDLVPDLRTFTVRMPDAQYDESGFAQAAARTLGTRHATLECDPNPAQDLVSLIQQSGTPLGDSSLLPAYWLSRAVRRHVKVALCGDGGDEMFLGYERYRATPMLRYPIHLLRPFSRFAGRRSHPTSTRSRAARLIDAAAGKGYIDLVSIFPSEMLSHLAPAMPRTDRDAELERCDIREIWSAVMMDIHSYLPDDLMRKTDTASMAVALEVRSPFLDRALAEAALSSTVESLMPRGQRKGLLRQVARKYLPAEIVDRPKMGFAIPIGEWFRSDYGGMKQLLLDHLNSTEPWGPPSLGIELNMKFVRQMLDEHMGTGMSGRVKRDHSQRLYMLLVLSIWAKWIGGLR